MTTIVCLQRGNEVVLCGDGQATAGQSMVAKSDSKKIRKVVDGVYCGFAGGVIDAFSLLELFRTKIAKHTAFERSLIEMAKEWRIGKQYRNLEATLIVTDGKKVYSVDGSGGLSGADNGVLTIGSGSTFAKPTALALLEHTDMPLIDIAKAAMKMAGDLDVYSNHNVIIKHFKDGVLVNDDTTENHAEI